MPFLLFSCSTASLFAAAEYFNYKNIFNWPKTKAGRQRTGDPGGEGENTGLNKDPTSFQIWKKSAMSMITFYCCEICLPRHIPHDKLFVFIYLLWRIFFIIFYFFLHPFQALNKKGRRGTKADRKNNINLIYFRRWAVCNACV